MMMTCRLLCGLLVLTLCCFPSVCMGEGDKDHVSEPSLESNPNVAGAMDSNGQASGKETDKEEEADPEPDPQKSTGGGGPTPTMNEGQGGTYGSGPSSGPPKPSAKDEADTLNGIGGKAAPQVVSDSERAQPEKPTTGTAVPNTEQGRGGADTQEAQSRNSAATDQTATNVDNTAETSAATTTNTTTTTTTTTAPEAPSTTTTEAPTTTTTGAPSRLREIDGSLSSSAWVCAPLLLAVSALAYTTLG
ncbi:mucin TcMUCII, putative [Trypanosoma cruzi marinkellei]|uniref:Mucin TcMUCII, putative n=1 Tax=Trypanosoma cruzi marinkellei TaxID=85056 RepID=K2MLZ5_TRYCR|nr:mucin TcMUCII, putative [Trypanosoma cruzi marinkellei]